MSGCPSRSLWQAVLQRQVDDALHGVEAWSVKERHLRIKAIEEARRYLTAPSECLALVCTGAGLEPDAVIEAMQRRIAAAPSPEELADAKPLKNKVDQPERKKRTVATYTLNGITDTVAGWSNRTGISRASLHVRFANGWSVEDALTLTTDEALHRARLKTKARTANRSWNRGSPAKRLTHNGQTRTIREWSEITGIKIGTIKRRIAAGMDMSAVLNPTRNRRRDTL